MTSHPLFNTILSGLADPYINKHPSMIVMHGISICLLLPLDRRQIVRSNLLGCYHWFTDMLIKLVSHRFFSYALQLP